MNRFLKIVKANAFILLLGLMIFSAFLKPEIGGAKENVFSLKKLADFGVLLIFFFYGVGLRWSTLWKSLENWRLHLVVQLATFLLFPLIVLAAIGLCGRQPTNSANLLWMGVFYVAALPSTVSSSVVMVSIAKGNMPAAIFNASISGVLGVFLTPLWMSLFVYGNAQAATENVSQWISISKTIGNLMLIVVLPLVFGMLLNPCLGDWMNRNRTWTKYFDQSIVLLIVYTSFCDSFATRAFDGIGTGPLLLLVIGMLGLFFTVYGLSGLCCHWLRFDHADTITVQFCGSKKSLMHGMAMSNVLFAGMSGVGVILLPIMLYHALQLIVVSVLAKIEARRIERNN